MSKVQKKQTNIREKLTELLDFRKMRDRLSGLGLYVGKDRTNTDENLLVRGGANVDDLQLAEISASVGGTAVDVFVYDTSRDSDGGKWRERTQHTSWYNEELNTATRGARREFPAVAVIVAEADKVTIYDGDDPDLSMWMVINQIEWNSAILFRDISCINATMVIGSGSGITVVNFINERLSKIHPSTIYTGDYEWGKLLYNPPTLVDYGLILHNGINDVSMTVLPNAPIDENTGLPVPTIAVATDGGVSVIRDDGTVVDVTVAGDVNHVSFTKNNLLALGRESNIIYVGKVPSSDISDADWRALSSTTYVGSVGADLICFDDDVSALESLIGNDVSVGYDNDSNLGLLMLSPDTNIPTNGLLSYITSKYNTGWMPGDIKLAALSDSVVENVGVSSDNLLTGNNSTFDGGVGDWSPMDLSSHDIASFPGTNSSSLRIDTDEIYGWSSNTVSTVVGQAYMIAVDYAFGTDCTKITVSDSTGGVINRDFFPLGGDGATSIHFIAESTQTEIRLVTYSGEAFFDNISVRATTELITNGDFSTALGSEWVLSVNSAPTLVGGALQFNYDGTDQSHAEQQINTVVGQRYVLSLDLSDTAEIINVYIGNGQGESQVLNDEVNTIGSHSFDFIAQSTTSWIRLRENTTSSSSPKIDNISVRIAEPDRSVNNNGLQIFGEIQKTPVASGADLVAYSGFSANNYLMQPYNADLDFGTEDFCVMGWVNQPAGQTSYLFDRRSGANDGISMSINTDNLLYVSIRNGTSDSLGGVNFPTGSWAFMSFVRRNGIGYIYINGIPLSQGNLDDDASENIPLVLGGISYVNEGSCKASLALFRISATAPTDAQIAKIYRDEKPLFREGAQATLYGTSDATTALSYDEKTELLHVGTSAGRSDFSGLRRINNTTTAITTSISAHNNLIAEQ